MPRRSLAATVSSALLGALLLALGPAPAADAATATTLYASPTGTGSSCTQAAPCSLTGAQARVRTLDSTMAGDIDVDLLGGTYRVTDPLRFGPQDSGENGHDVVYQAYPGQVPVISGAQQVSGFSLYDSGKNIYRADVPVGTQSRQLFVDGVRAQRARSALNPAGFTLSGSSFTTSDSSYASFTDQSQVEIVDDNAWKQLRCPLSTITTPSGGGSSLNVDAACFADDNTSVPNPQYPFNGAGLPTLTGVTWIENAYQLLTQPGQFYLDPAAGHLFYIPRPGEDLATADVELPTAQELVDLSGTPGHLAPVDDTAPGATYTGAWSTSTGRAFGDLGNDVHYTKTDGDSVSDSFTGTGLEVLGELSPDQGNVDVYVDGTKTQTVSTYAATKLAQQAIATVTGLSKGPHTVRLVKAGGTYATVDGFTVVPDAIAPVHDIAFDGITFTGTTWNQPTTSGYVDNQAGVLWDPTTHAPVIIPAAVQVHRGDDITFSDDVVEHTGGSGIDLADQTQDSTVIGSWITDTSGIGVSVGEVDDYYQTLPALQTSGDTVTENTIDHVGQDYSDAVGIWAGFTENATLSHNDIGYTPYSGISLGWGWAWQSDCSLIDKQHNVASTTPCRHGSSYAGGNQILDNDVHNVMQQLHDGGPIYTNGGQGGSSGAAGSACSATSVLSGNVVAIGNDTNNMIYHDEGSSCWNTHDNVVQYSGSASWVGMWTPTIHDNTIHDNYSDTSAYNNNGTSITLGQATVVTGGAWPAAAQSIIAAAGPSEQYQPVTGRIDDDNLAIGYTGSWAAGGNRGLGDYDNGVHDTSTNGDSAALTFTGTGVQVIGEKYSDQGDDEVYLDGVDQGAVSTGASTREAQQVVYSVSGLTPGSHTVKIVKVSGTFTTLDGFEVTRTVNDTDPAVTYTGAWTHATGRGDGDYGDDVHYTTGNGDSVSLAFYGTGVSLLTERNSDEGRIAVSLDGADQGTVDASATSRSAQQTVYTVSGLPVGRHTVTFTKSSGTYLLVDRFDVR